MDGAHFHWLLALGRRPSRLAHQGLLTLALGVIIALSALLTPPPARTPSPDACTPQLAVQAEPALDTALVLARLWFLAPQLLRHDR